MSFFWLKMLHARDSYRYVVKQSKQLCRFQFQTNTKLSEFRDNKIVPFFSSSLFRAASSLCFLMIASRAKSLRAWSVLPSAWSFLSRIIFCCRAISSLKSISKQFMKVVVKVTRQHLQQCSWKGFTERENEWHESDETLQPNKQRNWKVKDTRAPSGSKGMQWFSSFLFIFVSWT